LKVPEKFMINHPHSFFITTGYKTDDKFNGKMVIKFCPFCGIELSESQFLINKTSNNTQMI
jgi:hypothetical protein